MNVDDCIEARSVPEPNTGCLLWAGPRTPSGYGIARVRGRAERAHRASYELAVGPIPPGMVVCHRCDTPACVEPAHLFVGTQAENLADMTMKGRRRAYPTGECHPMSKLTESVVREMRALRVAGASLDQLAERFGTTAKRVSDVCTRRSWAHVR